MKHIEKLVDFENFKMNEMVLPVINIDEILNNVEEVRNNTQKKTLSVIFKTFEQYIDLVDKKQHHFKIHDIKGDIMNNNRISFDVYIYNDPDLEQIQKNIIFYAVSEFFLNLPTIVNVFGIDLNVASFIDKEELKNIITQKITKEETIKIITQIININYKGYINNCYIWSNE